MTTKVPIMYVSDLLPFPMSPTAEAKAIVRYGFAETYDDFERWYPEELGPEPGLMCHVYRDETGIFVSKEMYDKAMASIIYSNLARPMPIVVKQTP